MIRNFYWCETAPHKNPSPHKFRFGGYRWAGCLGWRKACKVCGLDPINITHDKRKAVTAHHLEEGENV